MSLKIEYSRVSSDNLLHEKAMMCAELYCQIWKEPPWLEDFWKSDEVLEDMKVQLKKDESICIFAEVDNSQIVGFTWGYVISQSDMWNICGNSKLDFIFSGERVFYVDELGVNRLYRNRGIGKSLTGELIRSAKEKGIKSAVLRTNIIAEPAIAVYGKMGFINLNVYDEKYPDRTYWSKDLT